MTIDFSSTRRTLWPPDNLSPAFANTIEPLSITIAVSTTVPSFSLDAIPDNLNAGNRGGGGAGAGGDSGSTSLASARDAGALLTFGRRAPNTKGLRPGTGLRGCSSSLRRSCSVKGVALVAEPPSGRGPLRRCAAGASCGAGDVNVPPIQPAARLREPIRTTVRGRIIGIIIQSCDSLRQTARVAAR